jgi:ATP-binding cassette, subfamily B, multidrug efflux pump
MKHIAWIWRFWQPHRPWLFLLALLTLVSSGVTLAYPLVLKQVIDNLTRAQNNTDPSFATQAMWVSIGQLALIGVLRAAANLYPGARAMLNAKLEMDVREHYFSQILTKGHRFFQHFRTGDLVTRLTDDIGGFPKIAWFCCSGIFRAVESASKFLFCMSFMLTMNWKLALVSMLPLPIMLFIFYRLRRALGRRSTERQEIISSTNDVLEAAFSGIRILKAFNGEASQAASFRGVLERRIGVELGVTKLWVGMRSMYDGIQHTGHILVIVVGGLMVINGDMTIGTFYAFYLYQGLLLQPLLDIPNLFVTSKQAFACIDREIEIEETDPQPAGALRGGTALPHLESIELRGTGFTYDPGLPPALAGIDLRLERGQRAAVVGAVGSGKSTLIKLAAGILTPTEGRVLINGRLAVEFDLRALRERMGYIPQEANLFSETVADNVSFGRELPIENVEQALAMAQVLDEMRRLPDGIRQVLGQRGLTVSGGQKQRLAIARALAGSPDLLLMDDVTASLDAENERRFWDMLGETLPDAMCLIVTHRLATARKADVVYMLEEGRIVGQGTHAELVQSCEPYRNFLTREELAEELQVA